MHIPAGIISLWFGAIIDIPVGWALCDGNNGTPDLTDRFVIGAGDSYNPGDIGGSELHNHDFTGDGHTHTLPGGEGIAAGVNIDTTTLSTQAAGTTDNGDGRPPFYALAYIMSL